MLCGIMRLSPAPKITANVTFIVNALMIAINKSTNEIIA
jgi:hypothetical protein